jgi:arylamine N-acetyltransferase
MIDFDAYLRRIGMDPAAGPAWQAVHRAHATSIPFENLDSHRGIPVSTRSRSARAASMSSPAGAFTNPASPFASKLIVSVSHDDGRREGLHDFSGPLVALAMSPDDTKSTEERREAIPSLLTERFGLPGWDLGPDGRVVALAK